VQATPLIPVNPGNTVQGSGTIAIALDANLNFDTGGKIANLYVKQGDSVTKGKVLAKLDTSSLEATIAQDVVNLDQAILAQTTAQLALETAKFNLDKSQAVSNIKDVITNLEWEIKVAQMSAQEASATANDVKYWTTQAQQYQKDLTAEIKILTTFLSDPINSGAVTYDVVNQPYDRLTVADMRMKEIQVQSAQQTLDKSQDVIDQAQKNLDLAQKQLDNAVILAPFDGVIATLNVKQGDTISAPNQSTKPVIYLVDPTSMQIVVIINELDSPQIKIGQPAAIAIDAFPNAALNGKVTGISLLPDLQGGVVNYDVTVSFNVPPAMNIRSGMNATAVITTN
jgi:multidrug resistance efflux pump